MSRNVEAEICLRLLRRVERCLCCSVKHFVQRLVNRTIRLFLGKTKKTGDVGLECILRGGRKAELLPMVEKEIVQRGEVVVFVK
jgi:hypothetical protein